MENGMLELNIKGSDVGELYTNAMNMFVLLTKGGTAVFTPAPPADVTPPAEPPARTAEAVAVPEANPTAVDALDDKPKRRGRPPKPAPVIEATADPVPETPADDDPLGLSDVKPATVEEAPAELTLDDMRDRVKAIIKAHNEDRGHGMPDCIAYVRKLFAPFGVKLAAELKPDQFAEFWSESQKYLDGSAK
jgi:hypothetical protein